MRTVRRYPPLSREDVLSVLDVDVETGRCYWNNVSRNHRQLNGREAGTARYQHRTGKFYWHVKIGGIPYKRSYLVYVVKHGIWPSLLDHIDGQSLNDSSSNIREATITQNAWNQPRRAKRSLLPMGVREISKGSFQVRIACNKKTLYLGTYSCPIEASGVYIAKRKELFGAYSGL